MRTWSTYRVQLHPGFTFRDAAAVAPYLADLGITHMYCSPYLQAAPGSTHGYDIVDPASLNEELGGEGGYSELVRALHRYGLGQILDIVPNHMAVHPANRWWWDVLENGPSSRYARFFDIDWEGPEERFSFTVLVPVLEDHYGRELEAGKLQLRRRGGEFVVIYREHRVPISPRTLDLMLSSAAERTGSAELAAIAAALEALPPARSTDAVAVVERHERSVLLTAELASLCDREPQVREAIDAEVSTVNREPDVMDALLRRQNYRLAHWRTASEELDYRRFFSIETLVAVREEDPEVFQEVHRRIFDLVRSGAVDGLRIDHVDGLRDPEGYLSRLAENIRNGYTVVEKILESGESLPESWRVDGTSGYDFLNRVNNLFVATEHEDLMSLRYSKFTGEAASWSDVALEAKRLVMREELSAEVERVTGILADIAYEHRRHRDHTRRELRETVRELVARFPVYRIYTRPGTPPPPADLSHVAKASQRTISECPHLDAELVDFVGQLALCQLRGARAAEFAFRFQQLTAPVMAKGVEDTAFYRYNRLVSLNEVGGDPGVFGRSVDEFHHDTSTTAHQWPDSMLTLSTHDTKRSADVRARLNVLSEVPDAWCEAVELWAELGNRHRNGRWPDRNAEYLLYQTLVGAWPIPPDRVVAYMAKASKEAKVHTSWTEPDSEYDLGLETFVRRVLDDTEFTSSLEQFLADQRIVERGRRNSLSQTSLLLTCPGVADIYQGNETWDFSLVDPDNRRDVDYSLHHQMLRAPEIGNHTPTGAADGSKLALTQRLLTHRREHPELYESVTYEPIELRGPRSGDALGFHRGRLAVVVPRRGHDDWAGTVAAVPAGTWTDVLSGEAVDGGRRKLSELFGSSRIAILCRPA